MKPTEIADFGTAKRRVQDLEMMRTPDNWPIWPRLPLKRPGHGEHGYLVNTHLYDNTVEPKVYMGLIFEDHGSLKFKEYESLQAIVDDGWTVD